MKITKDESDDIGFVCWCLACEAISKEEFRQWVIHVIDVVPDPPPYVIDLLYFDGFLTDLHKIIPFSPESPTEREIAAISGIALNRGVTPYEPVDEESCLRTLSDCSYVSNWFSELFPFIESKTQNKS